MTMTCVLDTVVNPRLTLLRRQYLQLIEPDKLTIPPKELLRLPDAQAHIFDSMFNHAGTSFLPPNRYRYRVLKILIKAMEQAFTDPEEDEISDDLTTCFAELLAQSLTSQSESAQQKSYVTYTAPVNSLSAPEITLLEARSLLASSGTTGFRTWEAALLLGTYLFSSRGRELIGGKKVLELGAGTGFLSILCARHLNTRYMLATDGSEEIVADIRYNLSLNGLGGSKSIETAVFSWGHTLISDVLDCHDESQPYDVVLGADVTYDVNSVPALVSTLRNLFDRYPGIKAVISATVRNEETLENFTGACGTNDFNMERLALPVFEDDGQIGFFFPTSTPIHVFLITGSQRMTDPFAM